MRKRPTYRLEGISEDYLRSVLITVWYGASEVFVHLSCPFCLRMHQQIFKNSLNTKLVPRCARKWSADSPHSTECVNDTLSTKKILFITHNVFIYRRVYDKCGDVQLQDNYWQTRREVHSAIILHHCKTSGSKYILYRLIISSPSQT